MNMKRKNLVVIHLESLSNEIYHLRKNELSALNKIMSKSIRLNNFFSSATSSMMAVTDFFYGNDGELDESISFDELRVPKVVQTNLFDLLNESGYETFGLGYPSTWRDDLNNFNLWSSQGHKFSHISDKSKFKEEIKNTVLNDNPFAMYIWDLRSHLFYMDEDKLKGQNSLERISLGYKCIDETLEYVIGVLEENNLMDNTMIVGFGDHGDDFWTHSLNQGFCHGSEPYTNMIWTPAFIYDSELTSGDYEDLVSMIDLRQTILSALDIKEKNIDYEFKGKDIFKSKNQYVFSRNFFANQKDNKIGQGLNKSFSVTNKDYNLVVSKEGLELFFYRIDPTNHSNLLSFFNLNDKGELTFNDRGATHIHFRRVFQDDQIENIKKNFSELVEVLLDRVNKKNKSIENEIKYLFNIDNFYKIRQRKYTF